MNNVLRVASDETERLHAEIARLNALVHERTRELDKARAAANHDDLTGLFNRRAFREGFGAMLATACKERQPLALVMFDLDGFKQVNDLYGHAAGDVVLQTMAHRIRSSVNMFDPVWRYGGDEFAIAVPNMDRPAVARVVEAIRQIVATPFRIASRVLELTVSAGIAMFPQDGGNAAQLLEAADATMFRNKRQTGPADKPRVRSRWNAGAVGGIGAEKAGTRS